MNSAARLSSQRSATLLSTSCQLLARQQQQALPCLHAACVVRQASTTAVRQAGAGGKPPFQGRAYKETKMLRNRVKPHELGVIKAHDAKHTGGMKGDYSGHTLFMDDLMIRNFVEGTFYELLTSEVVIKRRLNHIIITFYVTRNFARRMDPMAQNKQMIGMEKVYFLKGYTERMLETMFGCFVKLEIRSGPDMHVSPIDGEVKPKSM